MNRSTLLALAWLALAIVYMAASLIRDVEVGTGYWFALGASLFFLGVSHIVTAVKNGKDIA